MRLPIDFNEQLKLSLSFYKKHKLLTITKGRCSSRSYSGVHLSIAFSRKGEHVSKVVYALDKTPIGQLLAEFLRQCAHIASLKRLIHSGHTRSKVRIAAFALQAHSSANRSQNVQGVRYTPTQKPTPKRAIVTANERKGENEKN